MRTFKNSSMLCAFVLSLQPVSAVAQENNASEVVDELVVTTTRAQAPRLDNPGNITTLDPDTRRRIIPQTCSIRRRVSTFTVAMDKNI